jgi:hypothetical protein
VLNRQGKRVRATKSTPRDPVRVLERRHALAEIVERGAVGVDERRCDIRPKARAALAARETPPRSA